MIRNTKAIIVAIGLIILCLAIVAVAQDSQRKCPKKSGNFPIPGSLCKSYFICKDWRAIGEATCKTGQHFHEIKGWCDSKHLFPCLEKPKSKECLRDNGRFLKPGSDCMWYYDCCNGEAKEKRCKKGKLFDKNLEKCVSSSQVNCKEKTSKESTSSESTSSESSEESISEETFSTTSINDKVSVSFQPKFSTVTEIIKISTAVDIISTTTDMVVKDSTLQELSSSYQTSESDSLDTTFEPTSSELMTDDNTISSKTIPDITTESIFKITSDSLPKETSDRPNSMFPDITTLISSEATTIGFKPEVTPSSIHTTQSTTTSSSGELTSEETLHLSTTGYPPSSILTTYFTQPDTTKSKTIREVRLSTKAITDDLSTIDPEIADFVCPEPTGYFPHPTDKHKFIGCVHNRPSVLTCPSNLIYNHKYRRCLYKF